MQTKYERTTSNISCIHTPELNLRENDEYNAIRAHNPEYKIRENDK